MIRKTVPPFLFQCYAVFMFLCSWFLRSFCTSFFVSRLFAFRRYVYSQFLPFVCWVLPLFPVSACLMLFFRWRVLFFVPVLPMCVGISLRRVVRSFCSSVLRFFVSSFVRFSLPCVLRFSRFFVSPCFTVPHFLSFQVSLCCLLYHLLALHVSRSCIRVCVSLFF